LPLNSSNNMQLLYPQHWKDYELIDSGEYEKLERFGEYVLRRPEPQAVWSRSLPEAEWRRSAHAFFKKEKGKQNGDGSERGAWTLRPEMPEQWFIDYRYGQMKIRFRLGLTAFKHVGIFPEQSVNWNFIYDVVSGITARPAAVLNLFAYTGGASLAAKAAGADVTHVDAVRQVIAWSKANMEASGLRDIRWVVEDAMKFVEREVRRGKKYHGIILDPPAYGRGPEGEKWVLQDDIASLMRSCSELLHPVDGFFVLNLYSMGFSSLVAGNLIKSYFPNVSNVSFGELCIAEASGKSLPLSVFARFTVKAAGCRHYRPTDAPLRTGNGR
jgi:23S rRNA (cytosine1962-C5)-methyltransferase